MEVRPPPFPRSSQGTKDTLRKRLLLSELKPPSSATRVRTPATPLVESYGYGEGQFDQQVALPDLSESEFSGIDAFGAIYDSEHGEGIVEAHSDLVGRLSVHRQLPGVSILSDVYVSTSQVTATRTTVQSTSTRLNSSVAAFKSSVGVKHLELSQKLEIGGWDSIAASLAEGQSEFGYVTTDGDPYEFSIATRAPANLASSKYNTLSKHGLVRFDKGVELTDLASLVRERDAYKKIRKIPFFARYCLWKPFLMWRTACRVGKYRRRRKRLQLLLGIQTGVFVPLLNFALDRLVELRRLRLMDLKPRYGRGGLQIFLFLEEFASIQKDVQQSAAAQRAQIEQTLLKHLCEEGENLVMEVMRSAQLPAAVLTGTNMLRPSIFDVSENNPATGSIEVPHTSSILPSKLSGGGPEDEASKIDSQISRTRASIIEEANAEAMKTMTYIEKANLRLACRRLACLLRLLDFKMRDTLYDAVHSTLLTMKSFLQAGAKFFRLNAILAETTVESTFSLMILPTRADISIQLQGLLRDTLGIGSCNVSLLSYDAIQSDLLLPVHGEITNIALEDRMADTAGSVHVVAAECFKIVLENYNASAAGLGVFDELCARHTRYANLLKQIDLDFLLKMAADDVDELLSRLENELEEWDALPLNLSFGVFWVDLEDMRRKMKDLLQDVTASLHKWFPEVFSIHANELYKVISAQKLLIVKSSDLSDLPPLKEYLKTLATYRQITTGLMPSYVDNFASISRMQDIIETHNIKWTPESEWLMKSLPPMWQEFEDAVIEFGETLEIRAKHYLIELKGIAQSLTPKLQEATAFLSSGSIGAAESEPEAILDELHQHCQNIEEVARRSGEIMEAQDVLGIFKFYSSAPVLECLQDLQYFVSLWEIVREVRALQQDFFSCIFSEVDCGILGNRMSSVAKEIRLLFSKKEETSGARQWLIGAVEGLQLNIPLVAMMRSHTLFDSHKQHIEALVDRNIYTGSADVTVAQLLSSGNMASKNASLSAQAVKIHQIFEESVIEYNLMESAKEIESRCSSLEVSLIPDLDNKIVLWFGNLAALSEVINDAVCSLQSIAASHHAVKISSVLNDLRAQASMWQQMIETMSLLQQSYMHLRPIFANPRMSRYLTQAHRDFKVVDDCHRRAIKFSRENPNLLALWKHGNIATDMAASLDAGERAEATVHAYIESQVLLWPKLRMLTKDIIFQVCGTQDPQQVFALCSRSLFPRITSLVFDTDEPFNTVGVRSYDEVIVLPKASSARVSLVDWFKSIDAMLTQTITDQIPSYFHRITENNSAAESKIRIAEEIALPGIASEQVRICCLQVVCWQGLRNALAGTGETTIRTLLQMDQKATLEAMKSLFTQISTGRDAYHRKTAATTCLCLLHHRDILDGMLASQELMTASSFQAHCSLKKTIIPATESVSMHVVTEAASIKIPYGCKYQGFNENRLILTPLSERCLLAIASAFGKNSIILKGNRGIGKRSMAASLCAELGYDYSSFDCVSVVLDGVPQPGPLLDAVSAAAGCSLWLVLQNSEILQFYKGVWSTLLTAMGHVLEATVSRRASVTIGGAEIPLLHTHPSFLCMHLNVDGGELNENSFPASIRQCFRVLHVGSPERRAILNALLAASGFGDVQSLSQRIDAFCEHIVARGIMPETIVMKTLVRAIRLAASRRGALEDSSRQASLIATNILRILPPLEPALLRGICNLFLGVVFTKSDPILCEPQPYGFGAHLPPSGCSSVHDAICHVIQQSDVLSLVVVGPVSVGKTTSIKRGVDSAIQQRKELILQQARSGLPVSRPIQSWDSGRLYDPYLIAEISAQAAKETHVEVPDAVMHLLGPEKILRLILNSIDAQGQVFVLHLQVHSSVELDVLMSSVQMQITQLRRPVKIVWEITEISSCAPTIITIATVMPISRHIYSLEEVLVRKIDELCTADDGTLRGCLQQCIEDYLMPCSEQAGKYATNSSLHLASKTMTMMHSIYNSAGLTTASPAQLRTDDPGSSRGRLANRTISSWRSSSPYVDTVVKKWSESTCRRLFVFACIWTYGVAQHSSRNTFDRWFKYTFGEESEGHRRNSGLPPLEDGQRTIFDYMLRPIGEGEVELEWFFWEEDLCGSPTNASPSRVSVPISKTNSQAVTNVLWRGLSSQLLVPTSTSAALSFIQKAYVHSGGHLLLVGAPGSGVSSTMHLITRDDDGFPFIDRWVAHARDCGAGELHRLMRRSMRYMAPNVFERGNSATYSGCIIVEDVSLVTSGINRAHAAQRCCYDSGSCVRLLRSIFEASELYMPNRETKRGIGTWKSLTGLYSLMSGSDVHIGGCDHGSALPPRHLLDTMARYQTIVCIDGSELPSVLETKVKLICPSIGSDILRDIRSLTCSFAEHFRKLLTMGSVGCNPKCLLSQGTYLQSAASMANFILTSIAESLASLTAFTTNDVIRVWERQLADLTTGFPYAEPHVTVAIERALSEPSIFSLNNFHKLVLKERDARAEAVSKGDALPGVHAFSKSGPGVCISLQPWESIRELCLNARDGYQNASPQFWADVQRLAGCISLRGQRSIIFGIASENDASTFNVINLAATAAAATVITHVLDVAARTVEDNGDLKARLMDDLASYVQTAIINAASEREGRGQSLELTTAQRTVRHLHMASTFEATSTENCSDVVSAAFVQNLTELMTFSDSYFIEDMLARCLSDVPEADEYVTYSIAIDAARTFALQQTFVITFSSVDIAEEVVQLFKICSQPAQRLIPALRLMSIRSDYSETRDVSGAPLATNTKIHDSEGSKSLDRTSVEQLVEVILGRLCDEHLMEKVSEAASEALRLLPAAIALDSREVSERFRQHTVINIAKAPTDESSRSSAASSRRRILSQSQGASQPKSTQGREFTPLWAFAFDECLAFNSHLRAVHATLLGTFSSKINLRRHLEVGLRDCLDLPCSQIQAEKGIVNGREQQEIALRQLIKFIDRLTHGWVPISWLGRADDARNTWGVDPDEQTDCSFSIDFFSTSELYDLTEMTSNVSFVDYAEIIRARRRMLAAWVSQGSAPLLRLELIESPLSLLHALRETFNYRTSASFETIDIDAVPVKIAAAEVQDLAKLSSARRGCSVLVTGVALHGAQLNEKEYRLESPRGELCQPQVFALQLSATERAAPAEDEFACPVLIYPAAVSLKWSFLQDTSQFSTLESPSTRAGSSANATATEGFRMPRGHGIATQLRPLLHVFLPVDREEDNRLDTGRVVLVASRNSASK